MQRVRVLVVGLAVVAGGAQLATAIEDAQAAGSVRASVSLTAPSSGVYGSAITLTGRLWRTGTSTGLSGATVWLQRSAHAKGAYGNLRSAKTSSSGGFSFAVTQTGAYDYRVTYGGSATYTKATSPTRYPVTNRKLLLDSIATTSWETGGLKVTGTAVPAPPNGTTVTLQLYSGGKWVNLASGKTTSGKVTISTTRLGSTASYRIVTGARYPYGAGTSAAKAFAHYRWRGAFTKLPRYTFAQGGDSSVRFLSPSEDPSRSTVTMTSPGGYTGVVPDSSGCTRARTVTRNESVNNGALLRHYVNQAVNTSANLSPGTSAELTLQSSFGTTVTFEYNVSAQSPGYAVRTRIQLLCAN